MTIPELFGRESDAPRRYTPAEVYELVLAAGWSREVAAVWEATWSGLRAERGFTGHEVARLIKLRLEVRP